MNEMIERVARAMWEGRGGSASVTSRHDMARAAIAAMRVPVKAMVEAGRENNEQSEYSGPDDLDGHALQVWQAMIDAALAG